MPALHTRQALSSKGLEVRCPAQQFVCANTAIITTAGQQPLSDQPPPWRAALLSGPKPDQSDRCIQHAKP